MAVSGDGPLAQLCSVAETTARRHGHELGAWNSHGDEGRRAECARCGAVAYVRVEAGIAGMLGRALTEACRPGPTPSAA